MPTERKTYRYASLESTNDRAKELAAGGEPDGTLVLADAQTAGRGRAGRRWITPAGTAIAMSLILRPSVAAVHVAQIAMLGGLALVEGIRQATGLRPRLKWPNDVLIAGRKVAGVLAEATFAGERLESVVLGMGVNVNAGPPPGAQLDYPATCLAAEVGQPLDREALIASILERFDDRYLRGAGLGSPALVAAWSEHLAMLGQPVQVIGRDETVAGIVAGVTAEGGLLLKVALDEGHEVRTILDGDVHLRG